MSSSSSSATATTTGNATDGPCSNASFAKSTCMVIYAKTIIHGLASKEPTSNGVVVIQNGIIQFVGTEDEYEDSNFVDDDGDDDNNTRLFRNVECCMPGMWDVHCHFMGALSIQTPHYEQQWKDVFEDRAIKVGRDVPRLATILQSGFTSVREVGGNGKYLKVLVEEGSIPGPRIYHADTPIHITGGHCDYPADVPYECFESLSRIQDYSSGHDHGGGCIRSAGVDGPIDCMKAVRHRIRAGASVIKICCSGGVMTPDSGLPSQQQFQYDEIAAMTREATLHDRLVCAHVHSKAGILAALNNGVKCIEHCTLADEEVIDLIIEKDAIIVPTRWVIEQMASLKPGEGVLSEKSYHKLQMVYQKSIVAHQLAIERGVKICTGCDIFVAEGYGTSAKELEYLVDLGMTPLQAIEAATANGPMSLGKQAPPLTGQIQVGYDADLICLKENPLYDVKSLQNHTNIQLVIKGGTIQKNLY